MIDCSIIISSYERLPLFRRTLWSIAKHIPQNCEVVICDDNSPSDILGELKRYSSVFPWTFIRFDGEEFTQKTGLRKFFNSPAATNNIAFRHSKGGLIFQQGNEILAYDNVYNKMLKAAPQNANFLLFSTTYDVPKSELDKLDSYGANLDERIVKACEKWPLQSKEYRSDVTNYISLSNRKLWEELGGYDERYYGGIAGEDSDFVRRARKLGAEISVSDAVSLHQSHRGKTRYSEPSPDLISRAAWNEGVANNRVLYDDWDEQHKNPQRWPYGEYGVKEVITNG